MTEEELRRRATSGEVPPAGMPPALRALWRDAQGDWHGAHGEVDDEEDQPSCRVHAYLHRKEGDLSNAGYWYRRAGEAQPEASLEEEWSALARRLLADPGAA